MADTDLFAPPTDEENELFGDPTEEEIQTIQAQPTLPPEEQGFPIESGGVIPSQLEAGVRGLAQGATLGLSDEAIAAMQSGGEIATTDKSLKDLSELYKQYRDIQRGKETQAREAHPGTYLAGEIGSVALPGGGGIGLLGKGLREAGLLTKEAKNLPLIKRIFEGAKEGVATGGATGFGTSEAENMTQATKDVLAGAALGGTFGGAVPVIGQAVGGPEGAKKLATQAALGAGAGALGSSFLGVSPLTGAALGGIGGPLLMKTRLGEDISRARELGKKGLSITGERAEKFTEKRLLRAADKIQKSLFDKLDENYSKKLDLFKGKPNESVNLSDLYKDTLNKIDESVANLELMPDEAEKIKTALQKRFYEKLPETVKSGLKNKVTDLIDPNTGEVVKRTISRTQREVPQGFEAVPSQTTKQVKDIFAVGEDVGESEMVKIAQQMSAEQVDDLVKEGVLRGQMTLEEAANFVRDFQRSAAKIKGTEPVKSGILKGAAAKASDMLETKVPEITPLNVSSTEAYKALEELGVPATREAKKELQEQAVSFTKGLEKQFAPEQRLKEKKVFGALQKALGKEEAQKIETSVRKTTKDYMLGKRASEGEQISPVSQVIGSFKDRLVKIANLEGKGEKGLKQLNKAITQTAREELPGMVEFFEKKATPAAKEVASRLKTIINSPSDEMIKNAMLFSLAQSPVYRKEFESLTEETPETQEEIVK